MKRFFQIWICIALAVMVLPKLSGLFTPLLVGLGTAWLISVIGLLFVVGMWGGTIFAIAFGLYALFVFFGSDGDNSE